MPLDENNKGFFQYGNEGTNLGYSYEDALVGDREGLEYLRSRITEALETSKEVILHDSDIKTDFTYVTLAERRSEPEDTDNQILFKLGCLTIALVTIALIILGAIKAFEIIS